LLGVGAVGNAAGIAVFAATMAGSAMAWRIKYSASRKSRNAIPAAHCRAGPVAACLENASAASILICFKDAHRDSP
jgi:hypothetical protein